MCVSQLTWQLEYKALFFSHSASHSISFPQRIGINSLSPMGWGVGVEQNEESANGAWIDVVNVTYVVYYGNWEHVCHIVGQTWFWDWERLEQRCPLNSSQTTWSKGSLDRYHFLQVCQGHPNPLLSLCIFSIYFFRPMFYLFQLEWLIISTMDKCPECLCTQKYN